MFTKRTASIGLLALILTSQTWSARAADLIERRGGAARLSGEITAVSKDKVTIKSKGENVDVPVSEIAEIAWEGEPAAFKSARAHEAAGRLTQAADGLAKAATDNKSPRPEIKADIDYLALRTTARQALIDPAKIPDVVKKLNDFQSKQRDSRFFYDAAGLLVDLNLQANDIAAAKAAAESLAGATASDQQLVSKIGLARAAMLENKTAEAQQLFEQVIASGGNSPAEETRKLQAKLGLASCQQSQSKFDEAVKLLDEVIAQAPVEDTRLQAEAYLRQGDCLQASGKNKDALLAYLHVDVLFSSEKTCHPEALYQLSRLWNAIQQPERANEAADKLSTDYPNSPWTAKLKGPAAGNTN